MSKELKSCPFCNQSGEIRSKDGGEWYEKFWVQCWVCGARGAVCNDSKSAIDAWNRRASNEI